MVSLATTWRLRQCRRDSVTTNYDCSNAFGSVAWVPLLAGITALTTEADVQFHSEQIAQQAFLLTASADNTSEMTTETFHPTAGILIGKSGGPPAFVQVYDKELAQNIKQNRAFPHTTALQCRCPATGK